MQERRRPARLVSTNPHHSPHGRLRQRTRVSVGEVETEVLGDGPPVMLVHGTPAWSYLWRGVIPILATRHRVHVLDLLGFGDSAIDPGTAPSIATQASALAELIDHGGLRNPSLVGTDIGSCSVPT